MPESHSFRQPAVARAPEGRRSPRRALRVVAAPLPDLEGAHARFSGLVPLWAAQLLDGVIDEALIERYAEGALDVAAALRAHHASDAAVVVLESVLADFEHAVASAALRRAEGRSERALGHAVSEITSELVSLALRRRDAVGLAAATHVGQRILAQAFEPRGDRSDG